MPFHPTFAAALTALAAVTFSHDAKAQSPTDRALECRVSYGLASVDAESGYDHVVAIENGCDFVLVCSVHSAGGERDAFLSAGETRAIVVDEGEASSEFRARVQCFPVEDA